MRYDDKFQKYRLRQSIAELERKAEKACRRKGKLWTQEEIDAARARAEELSVRLGYDKWGKTVKYYIKAHGETREDATPYRAEYEGTDLRWVAESAAEYDFHNRDGWECSWPITYTIIDDEGTEHDYLVECEAVPSFYATKKGD